MKHSITFVSLTIGLLGTACGGFTKIGEGSAGSAGTATGGAANDSGGRTYGGAAHRGGATPTGGTSSSRGGATSGGSTSRAGESGVGNAAGIGGATAPACKTDGDCPRSLVACQLCADGTTACPWAVCESGACRSGIDRCPPPSPCAGKACGEVCTTCSNEQPCPPVLMYCDDQGQCQGEEPTCSAPLCKTDSDCPQVELCAPCSDGSCADMKCVSGACKLACEAQGGSGGAGGGTCSAQGASCADGETCCAGLQCCAGVPVPVGNEYCGTVCPKSDVNIKRDFLSVDPDQILDKLSRVPVGTWAYRTEGSTERHIGPMAQDFKAAFQVGSSDRTILQVDADGVAFAAIQALNSRLKTLEEQNRKLREDLDGVRQRCAR